MRAIVLCSAIFFAAAMAGAAATTPEQAWKTGIGEENKDYAAIPHAMLKIQDAAYLGEGQSAVLAGIKGQPASWHWHSGGAGAIKISLTKNGLSVVKDGKPVDAAAVAKGIAMDSDVDIAGQPTQVGAGVNGWRIFVYNQKNAAALTFKGVAYFPYDPAFRLRARFVADPKLTPHVFRTSRGTDKQFFHAGDAHFVLKGVAVTLPFYADAARAGGIHDMTAFYTDELTGKGAYGAGRYVDAEAFQKFPPASITIDFNNAYNPNCARSAFFTCPVAIDTIGLAMMAGERDPHSLH